MVQGEPALCMDRASCPALEKVLRQKTQTGQDEGKQGRRLGHLREALALRVVQVQGQRLRRRNLFERCRLGVSPAFPSSWPWMLVLLAGVAAQ